jgi:hypothetical protein
MAFCPFCTTDSPRMVAAPVRGSVINAPRGSAVSFRFEDILELALTSEGPAGTIIFEMVWEEGSTGVAVRWDSQSV